MELQNWISFHLYFLEHSFLEPSLHTEEPKISHKEPKMEEKQDPSPQPQMSSQRHPTSVALMQVRLSWTAQLSQNIHCHPVNQECHWQTHEVMRIINCWFKTKFWVEAMQWEITKTESRTRYRILCNKNVSSACVTSCGLGKQHRLKSSKETINEAGKAVSKLLLEIWEKGTRVYVMARHWATLYPQ